MLPRHSFVTLLGALDDQSADRLLIACAHATSLIDRVMRGEQIPAPLILKISSKIRKVPDLVAHGFLYSCVQGCAIGDVDAALRGLLGLGDHLQATSSFPVAVAVFQSLRTYARTPDEFIKFSRSAAWALNLSARYDDARAIYDELRTRGAEIGNVEMQLEGEFGHAKLLFRDGQTNAARRAFERVMDGAQQHRLTGLLGRAMMDAGCAAVVAKRYVTAIDLLAPALANVLDRRDKALAFHNIAIAERELDNHSMARIAAERALDNSTDAVSRAHTTMLLCQLDVDIRQDISPRLATIDRAALPPWFAAHYHELLSRDLASRGDFTAALVEAQRMQEIVDTHKLGDLSHRVRRAMRDLRAGVEPAVYSFRPKRPSERTLRRLRPLETSIRELCAA